MKTVIMIVDDEDNFREGFDRYLTMKGYEVHAASNLTDARAILNEFPIDIVLLDVQLQSEYGPDLLDDINLIRPTPKTILLTAYGEVDTAVNVMKKGAFDFLGKPIDFAILENCLRRAEENITLQKELERYRTSAEKKFSYVEGHNPKMQQVFRDASRAARAGASVLIYGETGCGKEIIAKYIHKNSPAKCFRSVRAAAGAAL